MDFYKGTIPIINDDNINKGHLPPQGGGFGYVPRDYAADPPQMFSALPSNIKIIPPSEYDARYEEQEEQKSSLEHLYLRGGPTGEPAFTNLDQNGDGYCWAYSTGHAIMFDRLKANQPIIRLSPHGPAAIIKGGRDEGGWCGLSAKFAREVGYPSEATWPAQSRSLRNDTPAMRADCALHQVTNEFVDLTRDVYDQNLTIAQFATCLFNNNPSPSDFNWWGHSVCSIRWVRIEAGSWGPLIINSWLGWGRHGLAVLQGSKAKPDGALSILVSSAS